MRGHKNSAPLAEKTPKEPPRQVVDFKRIVDVLEAAGCEVREIKDVEGYLTVVLKRACWKSVRP
ncbi:MAG: hypothetical protein WC683_07820 [bacterium]